MQHWYVYYKLDPGERSAIVERVRRMQRQLMEAIDVRVRLLERTETAGTTTVMEVYEDIADPARFAAALDNAVRFVDLDAAHVATRRVERFQDA